MSKYKDSKNTIKAPVVLAEKEIEHLVEGKELIEPSALKITDVVAEIRNLKLDVVPLVLPDEWVNEDEEEQVLADVKVKVLIQGILHKQIFWVGKKDNQTYHREVNHPFSTFVLFTERDIDEFGLPDGFKFDENKLQAQAWEAEIESVITNLISPNRLLETVILGFTIKLEQLNQTVVKTKGKSKGIKSKKFSGYKKHRDED